MNFYQRLKDSLNTKKEIKYCFDDCGATWCTLVKSNCLMIVANDRIMKHF